MNLKRFPIEAGEVSTSEYESTEILALCDMLKSCRRFFDVGANRGVYSYYANQVMQNGKIFCFEADPRNAAALRKHAAAWAAEGTNEIIVVNSIVSDVRGMRPFLTSHEDTVGSIFVTPAMMHHGRTETVELESVCLDDYFEADQATVVKIDIEGGEYRALLGAERLLAAENTSFLMEIHWWGDPDMKTAPSDVAKLFFRHGYTTKMVGTHWMFCKEGRLRSGISRMIHYPRFALELQGRNYLLNKLRSTRK